MRRPPPPRASWAYFFDVDGTLANLAESPAAARIAPELLARVGHLVRLTHGAVAIVSGRTLSDIDALLGGWTLAAAAQHGAERRTSEGRVVRSSTPTAALAGVRSALTALIERHPALVFEDKGRTLALHYRGAPQLAGFAHRAMRAQLRTLDGSYAVQSGKRIVELLPTGVDKGTAVRAFLQEPPFRGRTPVFLGDDVTDERAFAEVEAQGGLSIKVGAGPSRAHWRLDGVDQVRMWLSATDQWPDSDHQGTT